MSVGSERLPDVSDTPDSDRFTPDPVALPPPAQPAAPLPPRRRSLIPWVVIVLLLAAVAWLGWTLRKQSDVLETQVAQQRRSLAATLEGTESRVAGLQQSHKTLESRLADASATNKILREELLAMGERASSLEDAVARLADNRMRGEVMLRLNEAEFLLLLGEERLRLFGDVPATIQAYNLADAALAGLDDPVMATLRQTLAAELLVLREVPADARPAVRGELAQMAARLPQLPTSREGQVASTDANDSRLMRLLAGLVTVRRVSERDAVLGPVQRETTQAALRLQLELAQAALARPDAAAFQHAIDAAIAHATPLFDARDQAVSRLVDRLRALRETTLVPELPALGATLQELRGLRATRSIGGLERATPLLDLPDPNTAEDRDIEGGE
jgi:uroporphyrin-3 C-methyltransferase